jgi:6-phosphogluconolactonase (cycloisomerase 2 family)
MKIRNIQATALALAAVTLSMFLVSCGGNGESLFPVGGGVVPKFLYTINDTNISGYRVNGSSGAVTPSVGSPFNVGSVDTTCPDLAAANPSGKFLFVPDACADAVLVFSIDQSTGALASITGSPFPTGTSNFDIQQPVVDPTGKFLYVPEDDLSGPVRGQVLGFKIADNGSLTAVAGSPFPAGGSDEGLVIVPSGKFLYVADSISPGSVTGYSINSTSGVLTTLAGSPFTLSSQPKFIVAAAAGNFLYATAPDTGNLLIMSVNTSTGAVTEATGSPFPSGATNPQALDISPSGKFLYVANLGDPESTPAVPGSVLAFSINSSTGALTAVPGSPYTAGANPKRIAADPSGKFVYVTNEDTNNLSVFSVNSTTGALTEISGSPFATGIGSEGVTITHQ